MNKNPNEACYEHPQKINSNINGELHTFDDNRVKKTLNCLDMRQQVNDRKREKHEHPFRLESLQKHPAEKIQLKRL